MRVERRVRCRVGGGAQVQAAGGDIVLVEVAVTCFVKNEIIPVLLRHTLVHF